MKKFLCIMLVLAMSLSLVACSQPAGAPQGEEDGAGDVEGISFEAGKYIGIAEGHNGSLEVEVEFSEDEILAIDVVNSDETEHLATVVFENMPKQIIEEQSLNVDSVSGATITSMAFKAAVSNAVVEAKGDPKLLSKKSTKELKDDVVELEADLVVVGGGAAGLSAALTAEQNGLSVILLEKNAMFGGHTVLSSAYSLVTGSKIQEELGVTGDTPEKAYDDIMEAGGGKGVPELLKLYTESMGEATDWTLDYVGAEAPEKLTVLAENSEDRALIYKGGGKGLIDAFINKLEDTTVEAYLDTRVTTLLTDGNDVVGVEAKHKDGTIYKIKADSTVLATGGYGARKDLLPESLDNFVYYGASLANGEGLEMGQEVGADTVNMGEVKMYPNGIQWKPGIAKLTGPGNRAAEQKSSILIDRNGKRVANEKGHDQTIINIQKEQSDGMLFMFMDASTFDTFRNNLSFISQGMVDGWLENNATARPIFGHGESIEEVTDAVGVDGDELKKTIERYNEFVENGEDKDFGRPSEYLKEKIGDGPYYLVEQTPRYATTLGGLLVNDKLEVVNTEGNPIKGLYSAGDTAGGLRGGNSISGGDVGWAITSGYVVGKNLVK